MRVEFPLCHTFILLGYPVPFFGCIMLNICVITITAPVVSSIRKIFKIFECGYVLCHGKELYHKQLKLVPTPFKVCKLILKYHELL